MSYLARRGSCWSSISYAWGPPVMKFRKGTVKHKQPDPQVYRIQAYYFSDGRKSGWYKETTFSLNFRLPLSILTATWMDAPASLIPYAVAFTTFPKAPEPSTCPIKKKVFSLFYNLCLLISWLASGRVPRTAHQISDFLWETPTWHHTPTHWN